MVPHSLQAQGEERRRQLRLRNWFTLLWLLLFSYTSQALLFGPLDLLEASGGARLLIFLGGFASFLGGFVAFDMLLERLYPPPGARDDAPIRRGRQI